VKADIFLPEYHGSAPVPINYGLNRDTAVPRGAPFLPILAFTDYRNTYGD
jgi:hypothetical protein